MRLGALIGVVIGCTSACFDPLCLVTRCAVEAEFETPSFTSR